MSTRLAGFCWGWRRRTSLIVMRCGRRSGGSRSSTENVRTAFRWVRIRSVTSSMPRKACYGRVSVKGDLDSVNGARLLTVVVRVCRLRRPEKDGVKDTRTPALRRADGFCELLRRYERAGLGPVEGGVKPHVTVTASAKDMTDLQALKEFVAVHRGTGFRVDGLGGPDQYRTLRGCWRATAPLPESCWTKMVFHSTAARKREQRRCRRGGRWRFVMAGARSRGCGTPSGWCDAPPYCSLERWRPNRSRQPDSVVRSPPPDTAPHRMAGRDRAGSENSVLSTDVG